MTSHLDTEEVLNSGKITISPLLNKSADNIAGALVMLGYRNVSLDTSDRAPVVCFSDLETGIAQPTYGDIAASIRPDHNSKDQNPLSSLVTSVHCDSRSDSYAELTLVAE